MSDAIDYLDADHDRRLAMDLVLELAGEMAERHKKGG